MKKNRLQTILFILLLILGSNQINSQALACNDMVNIALDVNGTYDIYPEDILEGGPYDYDNMQIFNQETGEGGDFLTVGCSDIGSFAIEVEDTTTGNTCWGTCTVEDKINPTPYAQNITASLGSSGSITVPASFVDNGSFDNCAVTDVTLVPNTFSANGEYPVTLYVTDQSGNSDFALAVVTIVGGTPECNSQMYISLDINGQAVMPAEIFVEGNADYDVLEVSLDNVNFGQTVSFDCDDIGGSTTVYVHIEEDGNEYNCSSEAMIEDKLAPVVVAQNYTIDLDSESDTYSLEVNDIDNGSFDNCTSFTLSLSQTEFTGDDWGLNQVVLTGTDAGGNVTSATSTVTVLIDGEAPPIQCVSLSTAVVEVWSGNVELWGVDFVINQDDFDQVLASFDPDGPFTETITAECGINSESTNTVYIKGIVGQEEFDCSVELTVLDIISPVVILKQNVLLVLENGEATLLAEDVDNGSYDLCTDLDFSLSKTLFTSDDIGSNQVWLTVTDENGNYNSGWTTVTVVNGTGCDVSNIIFPGLIEVYDENGTEESLSVENLQSEYGYTYEEVHPYTIDECESIYYAYEDIVIYASFGLKKIRSWTAIDWLTTNVISSSQLLKLYTTYSTSLACNDQVSVSVDSGPFTVEPDYVLEGGPYNYDIMSLVILDADDEVVENNIITVDYIGETLYYTVTDTITNNSCWGNIIVDGMIEGCTLEDEDISYPLPSIQLSEFDLDPALLSPSYIVENYGFELSELIITWPEEDCLLASYIFEDEVFELGGGSFKIERNLTAIDWLTYDPDIPNSGIWTFTQIITTGIDPASLICDVLPRDADVVDCDFGHTLEDDVEWPSDIEIADFRISPEDLIEFSSVDVLDSEPSFYHNVDDYQASYLDLVIDLTSTSLVIGRVWTVSHTFFAFTWTYNQTITIDISEFDNLVTVNTGTNRAMPGVMINDEFSTNMQGVAYVNGEPIDNIEYEDDYLNGLNVLDMLLIQRHILGLGELPENGVLAADVNLNEKVTAADLVELKKRILAVTTNYDWSFYAKTIDSDLMVEPKGAFTAIKAGDVDDTALLQGEDPLVPEDEFEILDILLNAGESYTIPVYLEKKYNAYGFEFRTKINEDIIKISDVSTSDAFDSFDYHITEDGILTIIAFDPIDHEEIGGSLASPVFTLSFEANANSLLSLALNTEEHLSYIATSDLELVVLGGDVEDTISTGTNSEELSRLSVYPNPTSDYLNIDLRNVTVGGSLEVSIYGSNGLKLSTHYETKQIDVANLNPGMYYYQIKVNTFTTTGKFMVIN